MSEEQYVIQCVNSAVAKYVPLFISEDGAFAKSPAGAGTWTKEKADEYVRIRGGADRWKVWMLSEALTAHEIVVSNKVRETEQICGGASKVESQNLHESDEDAYLLQNESAGYVGNSPTFWAEKDGYSQWVEDAKVWTKEEAEQKIRSTRGTHRWTMWCVSEILSVAKLTTDIQDLRKLVQEAEDKRED